jgi:NADH-quinone oxidoreductase subunit M
MAAVAALGLVLTAAYLLAVVRRVCMGPAAEPGEAAVAELTRTEVAAWAPLALLALLTGLWPAILLGVTNPAVHALMGGF